MRVRGSEESAVLMDTIHSPNQLVRVPPSRLGVS